MRNRKPRVLLDVDGVLADFLTPAYALLNYLGRTNHRPEDQTEWPMFDRFDKAHEPAFIRACGEKGWCRNIPIYAGAKEGYRALAFRADPYIVTAPMPTAHWANERDEWLHEHFGIPRSRIVHTSAKFLVAGDVLIDDNPDNIASWAEHHLKGLPLLWHQPYNDSARVGHRTRSWAEVMTHLEGL
jgi:5'(3')-deoxyribonucleotidase